MAAKKKAASKKKATVAKKATAKSAKRKMSSASLKSKKISSTASRRKLIKKRIVRNFTSVKGDLRKLEPRLPQHLSYEIRALRKDKITPIATFSVDTKKREVDIKEKPEDLKKQEMADSSAHETGFMKDKKALMLLIEAFNAGRIRLLTPEEEAAELEEIDQLEEKLNILEHQLQNHPS